MTHCDLCNSLQYSMMPMIPCFYLCLHNTQRLTIHYFITTTHDAIHDKTSMYTVKNDQGNIEMEKDESTTSLRTNKMKIYGIWCSRVLTSSVEGS